MSTSPLNFTPDLLTGLSTATSTTEPSTDFGTYLDLVNGRRYADRSDVLVGASHQPAGGKFESDPIEFNLDVMQQYINDKVAAREHVWFGYGLIDPTVRYGRGKAADVRIIADLPFDLDIAGMGEAHKAEGKDGLPLPTVEQAVELLIKIGSIIPMAGLVDTGNGSHLHVAVMPHDPHTEEGVELRRRWKAFSNGLFATAGLSVDKLVAGRADFVFRPLSSFNFKDGQRKPVVLAWHDMERITNRMTVEEAIDRLPVVLTVVKPARKAQAPRVATATISAVPSDPKTFRAPYKPFRSSGFSYVRAIDPGMILDCIGWEESGESDPEHNGRRYTRPNGTSGGTSALVRDNTDPEKANRVISIYTRVAHGDWGLIEMRENQKDASKSGVAVVLDTPDLITVALLGGDKTSASKLFGMFDSRADDLIDWLYERVIAGGTDSLIPAIRRMKFGEDTQVDTTPAADADADVALPDPFTEMVNTGWGDIRLATTEGFRALMGKGHALPSPHGREYPLAREFCGMYKSKMEKDKDDEGKEFWSEVWTQVTLAIMVRVKRTITVGDPEGDRHTVMVWWVDEHGNTHNRHVCALTAVESLDPEKILQKAGDSIPVYPGRRGSDSFESLRAGLLTLGTKSQQVERTYTRCGMEDDPDRGPVFITPLGAMTVDGIDPALKATYPQTANEAAADMGWKELSTDLAHDILAVNKLRARLPHKKHITDAGLGNVFATKGASGGIGLHLDGMPGSGKTWQSSMVQSCEQVDANAQKICIDISASSSAGVNQALPFFRDLCPMVDDANITSDSSPAERSMGKKILTAVHRSAFGNSTGAMGSGGGVVQDRGVSRGGAQTSGEFAIVDALGTVSRSLNFGITAFDTDWTAHHIFYNEWRAAMNRVVASFVQWVLQRVAAKDPRFAPDGTIKSLSATTKAKFMALAAPHNAENQRAADVAARLQFGWDMFREFCKDNGVEHLIPSEREIDEQIGVIRGIAKMANDHASTPELMERAIQTQLRLGKAYIGDRKGGLPTVTNEDVELPRLGWTYDSEWGKWKHANIHVGWILPDGLTMVVEPDWVDTLPAAENLPMDKQAVPNAMSQLAHPDWKVPEAMAAAGNRNKFRLPQRVYGKSDRPYVWPVALKLIGVGPEAAEFIADTDDDEGDDEVAMEMVLMPSDPDLFALMCAAVVAAVNTKPITQEALFRLNKPAAATASDHGKDASGTDGDVSWIHDGLGSVA